MFGWTRWLFFWMSGAAQDGAPGGGVCATVALAPNVTGTVALARAVNATVTLEVC